MPTISPSQISPSSSAANIVTWSGMATGDTINSWEVKGTSAAVASLQISGTFNGGTTAVMQVSNDGSTWFTAKDTQGDDVSATANAYFEISVASRYVRFSVASGSSDSVTAVLVMRG